MSLGGLVAHQRSLEQLDQNVLHMLHYPTRKWGGLFHVRIKAADRPCLSVFCQSHGAAPAAVSAPNRSCASRTARAATTKAVSPYLPEFGSVKIPSLF